jgi:hypothetical protein
VISAQETATVAVVPTEVAPTPTEEQLVFVEPIIESPRTDVQDWWVNEFWPYALEVAGEIEGCEISYTLIDVREAEVVNALPWTVDQNGEVVRGLIPQFCGTGGMLAISEVGVGFSDTFAQAFPGPNIGPTYAVHTYRDAVPADYLYGGLDSSVAEALHRYFETEVFWDGVYPESLWHADPAFVEGLGVYVLFQN